MDRVLKILSDKDRLIKRTQLNRSNVRIIGDVTNADDVTNDGGDVKPRETASHVEIFDDDDFYHQLLRDVIERKSASSGDPVAMSRRWLEVTRGKVKVKRDVDTKASKGRKIRYDVQSKLVNFMAPLDTTTWSDEQRDELFKSLYGHRFSAIMDR